MMLVSVIWLRRHVEISLASRNPTLSPQPHPPAVGDAPPLTVLVAAKDEEANIGRCLDGLLAQDYPNYRVVVINDRSSDQTGRIIDEIARRDSRVTALHVKELLPGWFGKNNAMRIGLEQTDSEWLAFTDADCVFESPQLLSSSMAYAGKCSTDMLSVLPRLEAGTFWERVIQPIASGILMYWFPPRLVNNQQSRTAYANGAFILMTRSCYQRIGGHEFAKATLNEDMHMARRAKEVGQVLHVVGGGKFYRVRMYIGLKQIWRGWSRIFYGCFANFGKLLLTTVLVFLASSSPYVTLLIAPLMGLEHLGLVLAGAAVAIVAQISVIFRFFPMAGVPPIWGIFYPMAHFICLAMLINAMTRYTGRKTTWRGTTYVGGAQVASS
jgi:chlorobactene glucosyltransferase